MFLYVRNLYRFVQWQHIKVRHSGAFGVFLVVCKYISELYCTFSFILQSRRRKTQKRVTPRENASYFCRRGEDPGSFEVRFINDDIGKNQFHQYAHAHCSTVCTTPNNIIILQLLYSALRHSLKALYIYYPLVTGNVLADSGCHIRRPATSYLTGSQLAPGWREAPEVSALPNSTTEKTVGPTEESNPPSVDWKSEALPTEPIRPQHEGYFLPYLLLPWR